METNGKLDVVPYISKYDKDDYLRGIKKDREEEHEFLFELTQDCVEKLFAALGSIQGATMEDEYERQILVRPIPFPVLESKICYLVGKVWVLSNERNGVEPGFPSFKGGNETWERMYNYMRYNPVTKVDWVSFEKEEDTEKSKKGKIVASICWWT